jgi:hypothetical protein
LVKEVFSEGACAVWLADELLAFPGFELGDVFEGDFIEEAFIDSCVEGRLNSV